MMPIVLFAADEVTTTNDTLHGLFIATAVLGGVLSVGQLVFSLIGFGHDADMDTNTDSPDSGGYGSSWFVGILSFKAISAAILLFGLCGLAADGFEADAIQRISFASLGGVGALFLVAKLMQGLAALGEEGTIRLAQAVGKQATVYLTIPANGSSAGKVTISLQNRLLEYPAYTAHTEALPTGSRVTVTAVRDDDTLEVAPETPHSEGRPYV